MDFVKYMHVERLGSPEVEGILDGECYFFPKIDGTNASVWMTKNGIRAGSRNRDLATGKDNAGFFEWVKNSTPLKEMLYEYSHLRLYGEWLVPHSLNTYQDDAWRRFYVFDVYDGETPVHYEEYKPLLDRYKIDYIPPIFAVNMPQEEKAILATEKNTFLIKDGQGIGEGVVIKNYSFKNRFGRTVWAKVVTNEFKTVHTKTMGTNVLDDVMPIEWKIVEKYVTQALVDKVYAKIVLDNGGFSGKNIPEFINTVYYDLVREEMWQIIKEHKNPTINFAKLMGFVFKRAKELKGL